jgi:hypothetical protein
MGRFALMNTRSTIAELQKIRNENGWSVHLFFIHIVLRISWGFWGVHWHLKDVGRVIECRKLSH